MTPSEYQSLALRTANSAHYKDRDFALVNWSLGIAGETAEVGEYFLDVAEGLQDAEEKILVKEVGDCLWYIAMMAEQLCLSLDDLREPNQTNTPTAFRLVIEGGKLGDYVKKVVCHGHELDEGRLQRSLEKVYWLTTQLCLNNNLDLSHVMHENIEKLKRRYPEGFSREASLNRDDSNG